MLCVGRGLRWQKLKLKGIDGTRFEVVGDTFILWFCFQFVIKCWDLELFSPTEFYESDTDFWQLPSEFNGHDPRIPKRLGRW